MTKKQKHYLGVSIDDETQQKLNTYIEGGLTTTKILRKALEDYFKSYNPPHTPKQTGE